MDIVTKLQKTIITIYAGHCYSNFRDNNLEELENKAKTYLHKFSNKLEQFGGGYGLTIMRSALSGDLKYDKEKTDTSTLKKAWLSLAIGFEQTCLSLKTTPKFLLTTKRLFAAPHVNDENFSEWVLKYKKELTLGIGLINGLESFKKDDFDIHRIIFEESL